MNKLLYLSDDDLQSQLATKYNLLVHIGRETFQYAIIDNVHGQVKVLAEFELPDEASTAETIRHIEQLPESSRQFKFSFNSIKISFDTPNYTFIPAELYQESDRFTYGKYVGNVDTNDLLINSIRSSEIKNVVFIESDFKDALNRIFLKPHIYNQACPFLEGIQRTLKREEEVVCFIDIQKGHFQFAFFKDYKLEFYNYFEFLTIDEFNYYLLNIIVSLEIALDDTPIYLSGRITEADLVHQRIAKYFENIDFIGSDEPIKYAGDSQEIHPHTFFSLFSLDLCE